MQYLRIRLYPFLFSFFFVGAIMAWIVSSTVQFSTGQRLEERGKDSVSELLQEYRKLSHSGTSDAERITKYEEWRQLLLAVVRDNPSSESNKEALREVVRICNALGDDDQSLRLLEELMTDETISLWEHYELQMQHAGVSHQRFMINYRTSEEECVGVVNSYAKSNELLDSLLRDTSSVPHFIEVTEDGRQHELLPVDQLTEQRIIILAQSGNVINALGGKSESLSRSAKNYFRQARERLDEWGTPRANLMVMGLDLEHLASNEALAAAYAGDVQDAYAALRFLNTLKNKRWPTSFYVEDVALRAFMEKGKEPRDFLTTWIEQNEDDERTALLVTRITDSFMKERPDGYLELGFAYK